MSRLDFTLAAGPVTVWPQVRAALGMPITYHYDPEFLEAFRRTQHKVAQVFGTSNDVLLMQGEAIVGLEGAARSLVRPGMPVLNLVQGVFGKGMGFWLKDYGADVHELEASYDEAVAPEALDRYLADHPEIELVAFVASETPSATVSDVEAFGRIAKQHDALTLVDTVSALGGMPLDVDAWGLDVCVAGAQKCLGGPPGVAMVTVSDAAWEAILANPNAPRDSYTSLIDWKEKWLEHGNFPYTPSISEMHGIEATCDVALEEGIANVIARHDASAEVTRTGVRAMGLELWARDDAYAASCATAVRLPDGLDDVELRTLVRDRYGVMLSSGQGAGNLIRIAHMGPSASGMHPIVGLGALGRALADLGHRVEIGRGLDAGLAALSSAVLAGDGVRP